MPMKKCSIHSSRIQSAGVAWQRACKHKQSTWSLGCYDGDFDVVLLRSLRDCCCCVD